MHLPAITVNIVIITALLSGATLGLFGGRRRLKPVILSVYVGIVLAGQLAAPLHPFIPGLNQTQTGWLLLSLPIIVFGLFGVGRGHKYESKGSAIANLIAGLLLGALVVAGGFSLLPLSQQSSVFGDSLLASNLHLAYPWLLGLMPVVALLLGLIKGREKH
jgi:hypothetical protein